ncbi:hypothetical protein M413DRAFT_7795 [Hebeloma cylindrosporum]|uniref:Uncharacterized protein n=1 Tax=Hebeloma cylindrosporum TaxID=76867 RepID=A0A0C3CEP7_HEBCY|nr:hypothetical protein M413DRAFT_7795 [Hebeloma cylindrosporum h7]
MYPGRMSARVSESGLLKFNICLDTVLRSRNSGNRLKETGAMTEVNHSERRWNSKYTGDGIFYNFLNRKVWLSKGTKLYQAQLSNPLKILFYELKDLPVSERQTVERFFEPSLGILTPSTLPISIIHSSHFIPNQIFASIGWECGREIRIYYLGPTNVLREYAYSASKSGNSWYNGSLQDLNIVLAPDSNVAAVRPMDGFICIYYQDINTDLIRVLYQLGSSTSWNEGPEIAMAVKGSGLAVVKCPESDANKIISRIYYQDPDLYLRERYFDHLGSLGQWVLGGFNPGVQLRGTPITAEVVHGGGVDINVMWRDPQGRPVTSSWSKFWGWDLLNGRRECDDGGD